jgi:hypothetical protein
LLHHLEQFVFEGALLLAERGDFGLKGTQLLGVRDAAGEEPALLTLDLLSEEPDLPLETVLLTGHFVTLFLRDA